MLKLIKNLTVTLGQEFRTQIHTNLLRIEDFVNKMSNSIEAHKTTDLNAHNSKQITDDQFGTVDNGLKTINKRYSNIVVSKSSGNNILEVKDARVDANGVDHNTLFDRLLSDGQKYGMDKEDIMASVQDAKDTILAQEFMFDIPNQNWQYLTNLSSWVNSVMQSFHIDNRTGLVYMTNAIEDGYVLSKMKANGSLLAQMKITGGGHGTHNGYRWEDDKFWIYSFITRPDGSNTMVRFSWRNNVTLTYGDYDMEEVETFKPERPYITPIINEQEQTILYRIEYPQEEWATRNSMNYIEIRNLADVDAGIDNLLYTMDIPMHLTDGPGGQPMQGVAHDDGKLYWYTGNSDPGVPNLVTVFDLETKEQLFQKQADIGGEGKNGPEGNFAEAEGIQMYYDYLTGKKALLAGVTTGAGNYRNHEIHGIFMRDVYDKLTAAASPVLMTDTGGKTKTFPVAEFSKIADIIEPGQYYILTTTSKNLSDFPLPIEMRKWGWWLEVSAPNVAGDVHQTLTRNSYTFDLMRFDRNVSLNKLYAHDGISQWNHIPSGSMKGPAEYVPEHITNMNQLGIVDRKQWYCTTERSSQLADHPRPGISGWTIDVENITSYTYRLTVTRVTTTAAVEYYIAYFSNTTNSRNTPWTKFQGTNI